MGPTEARRARLPQPMTLFPAMACKSLTHDCQCRLTSSSTSTSAQARYSHLSWPGTLLLLKRSPFSVFQGPYTQGEPFIAEYRMKDPTTPPQAENSNNHDKAEPSTRGEVQLQADEEGFLPLILALAGRRRRSRPQRATSQASNATSDGTKILSSAGKVKVPSKGPREKGLGAGGYD